MKARIFLALFMGLFSFMLYASPPVSEKQDQVTFLDADEPFTIAIHADQVINLKSCFEPVICPGASHGIIEKAVAHIDYHAPAVLSLDPHDRIQLTDPLPDITAIPPLLVSTEAYTKQSNYEKNYQPSNKKWHHYYYKRYKH